MPNEVDDLIASMDDEVAAPEDQIESPEPTEGDDIPEEEEPQAEVSEEDATTAGEEEGPDGDEEGEGEEEGEEAATEGTEEADTDKGADLPGEPIPEVLQLLRNTKPKDPPKIAFETDQDRVALRNRLLSVIQAGQRIPPSLESYLRGGQQVLQQQINKALSEDPDEAMRLIARQNQLNSELLEFQGKAQNAMAAQRHLEAMVLQDAFSVLPSRERVKEVNDMLIEASDGLLTESDLGQFHQMFSMGTAMQGKPLGHRFLYALSRIVDALQTNKTVEKAKATISDRRKTEQRAGPPKTIRSGAQSGKGKISTLSPYQQKLRRVKTKKGGPALADVDDLISSIGDA